MRAASFFVGEGALVRLAITRRGFLVPVLATLGAAACAPLTGSEGLDLGPAGWTEARATYGADPRQSLMIYRPQHLEQPLPVVLLVSSATPSQADEVLARQIAETGMVAIVVGRRSSPVADFPAYNSDNAKAVAWTYERATALGVSADHIGILGVQAGGPPVMLLARDGRYLASAGVSGRVMAMAVASSPPRPESSFTAPDAYVPSPSDPPLWQGEGFQIHEAIQYLKQVLS